MSLGVSRQNRYAFDCELLPRQANAYRRDTPTKEQAQGTSDDKGGQRFEDCQDEQFYECAATPPAYEAMTVLGDEWCRLIARRQAYSWIEETHTQDPGLFLLHALVLSTGCGICRTLGKGHNVDHRWRDCREHEVVTRARFWSACLRRIAFVPPPHAPVPPEYCGACWWPVDMCNSWTRFDAGQQLRGAPGRNCQHKGLLEDSVAIALAVKSTDVEAWVGLQQEPREHFNSTIDFLARWTRPKHGGWTSGAVANAYRLAQAFAGLGAVDLAAWDQDLVGVVRNGDRETFMTWYYSGLDAFLARAKPALANPA